MKLTDIPSKQAVPFGVNGQREALLPTTPAGDNKASYNNGFPPVTMILKSAGGVPPKGQDMNQILFELSALCRWFSAGGAVMFDSSFCSSIGGYPEGTHIIGDNGSTIYRSTIDDNTNNPNSSSTGWVTLASDISRELGLGTAAIRDVGNGANQIPNMSLFASTASSFNLPSGVMIAFGTFNATIQSSADGRNPSDQVVNFPVAFPVSCLAVTGSFNRGIGNGPISYTCEGISPSSFRLRASIQNNYGQTYDLPFNYIAIGRYL
ncbi:gp53-like domain-containing protein [Edwardsiella tarda]